MSSTDLEPVLVFSGANLERLYRETLNLQEGSGSEWSSELVGNILSMLYKVFCQETLFPLEFFFFVLVFWFLIF